MGGDDKLIIKFIWPYVQGILLVKNAFIKKDTKPTCTYISYSTIVLYSRDNEGVGVAHDKTSPKNLPRFSSQQHDSIS